jgi:hypothetical protein
MYSAAKNIFFIFFELKIRHELGCPITKSDFLPEPKTSYRILLFFISWEVKCAETEWNILYFPDKIPILLSITFLKQFCTFVLIAG